MYDLRTALDSLEIPRLQYRPNLEPDLIREALLEYCDLSPAELLQDDCPYPLANCWDDPTLDNLALALKYLDQ